MKYLTKNLCHDSDQDGLCDQCRHPVDAKFRGRQCPEGAKERGRPVPPPAKLATAFQHKQPAPGLGDKAEAFLKSIGITEERYKFAKSLLWADATCNCKGRKDALNNFGRKHGVDAMANKWLGWLNGGATSEKAT